MNFCGQLHLKVVCMGVENEEQAEYLKSIGCDYATGFYYYYPVSQDSFDEPGSKTELKICGCIAFRACHDRP